MTTLAKFDIPQDAFDAIKRNIEALDAVAPGCYAHMIRDDGATLNLTGFVFVVGDLPARLKVKVRPREIDVPHWARDAVSEARINLLTEATNRGLGFIDRVTHRMIFARLVEVGSEATDREVAEAVNRLIDETAPD